jgi:hypothetical protein
LQDLEDFFAGRLENGEKTFTNEQICAIKDYRSLEDINLSVKSAELHYPHILLAAITKLVYKEV